MAIGLAEASYYLWYHMIQKYNKKYAEQNKYYKNPPHMRTELVFYLNHETQWQQARVRRLQKKIVYVSNLLDKGAREKKKRVHQSIRNHSWGNQEHVKIVLVRKHYRQIV